MNVAIVDDHEIFRLGLRVLLSSLDEVDTVIEFDSGLKMLESEQSKQLDLLIIDFSMPDCSGLEIIRQLEKKRIPARVILLTASASSAILKEAKLLGASGLVAKRGSGDEVVLAVKAVHQGRDFISPDFQELMAQRTMLDALTRREMEVLRAILDGNSTREVAELLSVTFKTVDTHRSRLMQKLEVHSLAELMELGRVNGLLKEI